MSTKLYVGNLPYDTSEAALQALFEGVGGVSTVSIVRDRATGQARGFAFVEMSDSEGARRAISELDRREFDGRTLTVNEARPMAPRSSGGGFGGRQKQAMADEPDENRHTQHVHDAESTRVRMACQMSVRPNCVAQRVTYSRSISALLMRSIDAISRRCFSDSPSL